MRNLHRIGLGLLTVRVWIYFPRISLLRLGLPVLQSWDSNLMYSLYYWVLHERNYMLGMFCGVHVLLRQCDYLPVV